MSTMMENEFSARFSRYESELRWLYMNLYHSESRGWQQFIAMLRQMYDARPEKLRERDRVREANPEWYRRRDLNAVQLYTARFADNFAGLEQRLDYLQEIGVTCLSLMPVMQTPAGRSDGGFAVSDHRQTRPDLGTMEDFRHAADVCHERGMLISTDFTLNHISDEHEWARRARAGEQEYQERFFMYDTRDIPNRFELTVPQAFPTSAPGNFTWDEVSQKVVLTTFYSYQWDLDYHNHHVLNDMIENLLFLTNCGVDMVRLGSLPIIWKELGTSCRNLPQAHTITRIVRIATEIVCPGTLLLGEVVSAP